VLLVASLHALAPPPRRAASGAALVFAAVFATLIFFNYLAQTTFLPSLARSYQPSDAPMVAAFSMVNPTSLSWAIEMWGYGFLGVATWLVAPVLRRGPIERGASIAMAVNAPLSVVPAIATAAAPGWVLTPIGFVSFAVWNVVVAVMAVFALVAFNRRLRAPRPVGGTSVAYDQAWR
jgi:hypothetical protein